MVSVDAKSRKLSSNQHLDNDRKCQKEKCQSKNTNVVTVGMKEYIIVKGYFLHSSLCHLPCAN